jgi:hypothetical protein
MMGCSSCEPAPEAVRETRQAAVTPRDNSPVEAFAGAIETSIAFTPPQLHDPRHLVTGPDGRWIIGFIDLTPHRRSEMGWAWSDRPNNANSWTTCNAEGGDPNCVSGQEPGSGPGALGPDPSQLPQGWNFNNFDADPRVLTDGKGNVVFVNIAEFFVDANLDTRKEIMASLSRTGGMSFDFTTMVSDSADMEVKCAANAQRPPECACLSQAVDHPDATFDTTLDRPELWVVWRSKPFEPAATYGLCTRKGHIDDSGIVWDTDPTPNNYIDRDPFRGAGAAHIQAGNGAVTLLYETTDKQVLCPDTGFADVHYDVAVNTDGVGVVWSNQVLVESPTVQHCLVNATVEENDDNFSLVRVNSNLGSVDYAAIHTAANEIRIFSSVGGLAWRELCQLPLLPPFWTPAGSPCFLPAIISPSASLFFPELSVDGDGRLGLFYYESNPDASLGPPDTLVHAVFRGSTGPLAERPIWQGNTPNDPLQLFGPPKEIAPFQPPPRNLVGEDQAGPRPYGDYVGMTTSTPTTTCGAAGTFHAGFVINNGSDAPEIVHRQITLSPP